MQIEKSPSIAFAILTHNALDYTKLCLKSIQAHTPFEYDLYIVDNASSDGTPNWIKEQCLPNLHYVLSNVNLGVPGGRNRLLKEILPQLPDDGFIVFLDNDIELLSGWYQPFVEIFQSHREAGIASGAGHRFLIHRDWREPLYRPDDGPTRVDGVAGGFCCWVRKRTALEVGEFDENLGLFWHEDDDFCVRAIAKGHEVFFAPARIVHHSHKSGVDHADRKMAVGGSVVNQKYLVHKWRNAGYVDESGFIRHPAHNDLEQRRLLARMLGRRGPIPPQELERGTADLLECLAAPNPVSWTQEHRERLTPTLAALLEQMIERAPCGVGTVPAHQLQELHLTMAQQRYHIFLQACLEVPTRQDSSSARFCKLCDISDWEMPDWAEVLDEIIQQGYSQDYYRRERSIWEQVQLIYGLQQLGYMRPDVSGLVVGDSLERVTWAMANHLQSVTAVGGRKSVSADKQAPFRYVSDRLHVIATPLAETLLPERGFDCLICLSLVNLGDHKQAGESLQYLARLVKSGGLVVLVIEVVLNGKEDERLYLPEQVEELLSRSGLQAVEPLDFRPNLETLDRFYDDRRQPPYPHFTVLSGNGQVLSTSQTVFLKSPG